MYEGLNVSLPFYTRHILPIGTVLLAVFVGTVLVGFSLFKKPNRGLYVVGSIAAVIMGLALLFSTVNSVSSFIIRA